MIEIKGQDTVTNLSEGKHLVLVAGDNIYYNAKITNPNQKTLVMIHGAGAFAESWGQVTGNFTSDNFNWITLDMPGHLRSEGEAKMSIHECAIFINAFVEVLLEEYGLLNEIVLVGHSFGGAVAGEVATEDYEWLDKLVLVGTSSDFTETSSTEFIDKLANGELDLEFYKRGFSPKSPSIMFDMTVKAVGNVSVKAAYADFYATTTYNNTKKFESLNKPTLIISGSDDIIMSKDAAKIMHAKIKDSVHIEIPNAGHFLTTEAGQLVAEAIQDFITK